MRISKRMRRRNMIMAATAVAISFSLCACGGSQTSTSAGTETQKSEKNEKTETKAETAEKLVIQVGHTEADSEDSVHHKMCTLFKQYVAELSDGSIDIEIIPSASLGGERDMVEGMQLGTIEMASTAKMVISNFDPAFSILDLPYVYNDYESAYAVLESDELQQLMDKFAEESGVRILAYGQGGFRDVISNKAVISLNDFSGMKIRVPESDIYLSTFKAMNANPTPLAFNDVFTSLQQGTIDGFEIVPAVVLANGYYEVCSHVSLTRHLYSPNPLMISESLWSSLTEEQQKVIQEAADKAAGEQRKWEEDQEQNVFDQLREKGMTIDEDVDVEAMKKACADAGIYDTYRDTIGADFYDKVMNLIQK